MISLQHSFLVHITRHPEVPLGHKNCKGLATGSTYLHIWQGLHVLQLACIPATSPPCNVAVVLASTGGLAVSGPAKYFVHPSAQRC